MSSYGDLNREIVEHKTQEEKKAEEVINPTIYVCSDCGSRNVESRCWVRINDSKVMDSCEDGEVYCPQCGCYVETTTEEEYEENIKCIDEDEDEDDEDEEDEESIILPVCTKVKISKKSAYYGADTLNPKDEVGTIVSNFPSRSQFTIYRVQWKSGINCYNRKDLIVVK